MITNSPLNNEVIYTSIPAILESIPLLEARIAALDAILSNMEMQMASASSATAGQGKFQSYKVDTGQTKSEIVYKSIGELIAAYDNLMIIQQKMRARLNANRQGRVRQLIDGSNFR